MNSNPNNSSDNNAIEDDDYPCVDYCDALESLPRCEEIAFEALLSLDRVLPEGYDYGNLSAEYIFERIASNERQKHRLEEGFAEGHTKAQLVRGISVMLDTFWRAQEWARELKKGRGWDDDGGISDLTVDCYISECADYDEDLDAIRWRNPLLYSAICIELSRAVGSH